MIVYVLAAAAAAGAIVAWATESTRLAYVSGALAGLCVLVLAGVMLRERGAPGVNGADSSKETGEVGEHVVPVAEDDVQEIADESLVCVIPGRKRFHQPDCGLLAGRQTESLTLLEAHEEGFTPCSVCLPGALP